MASKSKTVATGVTRHAPSDGTFSSQVDVDLKGYDRLEETFATLDDAKTWRAMAVARFKGGKSGKYVAPEDTVGDLINRYVQEYSAMRGDWSRSKQEELDKLVEQIGDVKHEDFTKQTVIQYGKKISETRGPFIVADRVSIEGQGVEASRLFSTAHTVAAQ